jgi:hypothetical protein
MPRAAIFSRSSCAIKIMKFSTYYGLAYKALPELRILGRQPHPWGQVSRLQTRIINADNPMTTSGSGGKAELLRRQAGRAIKTSPACHQLAPSVSSLTLARKAVSHNGSECVSEIPSLPVQAAMIEIETLGAAPVPPS